MNQIIRIEDGTQWLFAGRTWTDGPNGLLQLAADETAPQDDIYAYNYAFHKLLAYGDVRIHFEFLLTPHSDVGVVFRATDHSHFSLLHFPNCGQACRAQNFWAALSRMDGSGYLRHTKLELVRRVPANAGIWLSAEVIVSGRRVRARIGDNGFFEAEDGAMADTGHIGIFSTSKAQIRNVTVDGQPVPPVWQDNPPRSVNWFNPIPNDPHGLSQLPLGLLRLPGGELLLNYCAFKDGPYAEQKTTLVSRSSDNGRTWSEPEALDLSESPSSARLWLTPAGRLICVAQGESGFTRYESMDDGRTWSNATSLEVEIPPKMKGLNMGPQAFLNLSDGAILWFLYGAYELNDPDLTVSIWGAAHCRAYCLRSTDDGRTWSHPANIDNSAQLGASAQCGSLDLTEVCAAQMGNGRILALIRPIYSPWMWEAWSDDGGATWGPCVRGEFPGYATPNMLRTGSGSVMVAHRQPALSIHCSRDDGRTWDSGTQIDSEIWAMGSMLEVEPDLILFVYMTGSLMRAQFIRIRPDSLEAGSPTE